MPRVSTNVARLKRKNKILKHAKGYFGRRKNLYKTAKEAVERGWRYSYRDRKNRKRDFRRLWVVRINAEFTRIFGYSLDEAKGQPLNDLIVPADLKDEGVKARVTLGLGTLGGPDG